MVRYGKHLDREIKKSCVKHTLTASWKHKYRPQLWDTAWFLAYPTKKQAKCL